MAGQLMSQEPQTREDLLAEIHRLRQQVDDLKREVVELAARPSAARPSMDVEPLFTILSALPNVIILLSPGGEYLRIFTGENSLLALPRESLLGSNIHDMLPAHIARAFQAVIDKTLATRQTHKVDYELVVESGTRWFNGTCTPFVLDGQECVMWVAHDVTERHLAEQEIQKARDAAVASNRLKSQFLANMSHEIRTPMNGVVGFIEILKATELSAEQRGYVDHIETCARTLLTVINDILDFSKIEADHISIRSQPFDLAATVRSIVAMFRQQNQEQGVELVCTIAPDFPPVVGGDEDRIRQILMNLIGNATKFTREGRILVAAGVESETAGHVYVHFQVSDTGIGISGDALASIFEPFVQVDGSSTRQYPGTGLGLAIVERLVGLMGGEVRVDSTVGVGTTFTFTIPLTRLASAGMGSVSSQHDEESGRDHFGLLSPVHVLVAEDNPIGQVVARKFLTGLGCTVDIVANGQEVLEALARHSYGMIFMDCQMPVLDGYETTRRIRAGELPDSRVPIVALTAHAMKGDAEACLAAGMDDYLSKPLDREALIDMLRKWARRRTAA